MRDMVVLSALRSERRDIRLVVLRRLAIDPCLNREAVATLVAICLGGDVEAASLGEEALEAILPYSDDAVSYFLRTHASGAVGSDVRRSAALRLARNLCSRPECVDLLPELASGARGEEEATVALSIIRRYGPLDRGTLHVVEGMGRRFPSTRRFVDRALAAFDGW
jgi:hypothetical protein